ncbi:MAG: hypothetical protein JF616_19390 [Fibrobacteres bacterium]|nr:hypothetical protein [Fibrobacterota bacterium]
MVSSRHDRSGSAISRLTETGIGLFLGISIALAAPAQATAGDTSGTADTLPPPGTFIAAYVADSATGLPLVGASLTIQNTEANITIASTDTRGWAYVTSKGLPSRSIPSTLWVTAGYPGYISRLITLPRCGSDTAPCALHYALARATENNSFTFTGALLDSARKPVAEWPIDLSSQNESGWITFLSKTDENGSFVFKDLPKGLPDGYIFLRSSPTQFQILTVYWIRSGNSIIVPRQPTTSLAPSRARPRVSALQKPAPLILFRSGDRDAAGRRD